jgi:hypothetical protein
MFRGHISVKIRKRYGKDKFCRVEQAKRIHQIKNNNLLSCSKIARCKACKS